VAKAQRLELSDTVKKPLPKGFTQVKFWTDEVPYPWFTWKLIPVTVDGPLTPSTESEHDEFGTVVTEVTTSSTVITTRKKYRVEDA
jgi:hypothetical protein